MEWSDLFLWEQGAVDCHMHGMERVLRGRAGACACAMVRASERGCGLRVAAGHARRDVSTSVEGRKDEGA